MGDRELLVMAAKAAGLLIEWHDWGDFGEHPRVIEEGAISAGSVQWNPLHDDGDALRLAVKMRMMVDVDEYRVQALAEIAMHEGLEPETVYFDGQSIGVNRGDVNSATRRAIVRAAAKIGKNYAT